MTLNSTGLLDVKGTLAVHGGTSSVPGLWFNSFGPAGYFGGALGIGLNQAGQIVLNAGNGGVVTANAGSLKNTLDDGSGNMDIVGDFTLTKSIPVIALNATSGDPDIYFRQNGTNIMGLGYWSQYGKFHISDYTVSPSKTLLAIDHSGDVEWIGYHTFYDTGDSLNYVPGTPRGHTEVISVNGHSDDNWIHVFCSTISPLASWNGSSWVHSATPIDPVLYVEQILFVEKDVQTFGALNTASDPQKGAYGTGGTGGGAIQMGHGFTAASDMPCINLTDYHFQGTNNNYQTLWIKKNDGVHTHIADLPWGDIELGNLTANGYVFVGSFITTTLRGPIYADAGGILGYAGSSIRFKTNVDDLLDCSWLYNLRPVTFDWKDEKVAKAEGRRIGLIAEEVNALCPQLTWLDKDGTPEGVHYEWLGIPLLVEIKKLRSEVLDLQQQVAGIKRGVNA